MRPKNRRIQHRNGMDELWRGAFFWMRSAESRWSLRDPLLHLRGGHGEQLDWYHLEDELVRTGIQTLEWMPSFENKKVKMKRHFNNSPIFIQKKIFFFIVSAHSNTFYFSSLPYSTEPNHAQQTRSTRSRPAADTTHTGFLTVTRWDNAAEPTRVCTTRSTRTAVTVKASVRSDLAEKVGILIIRRKSARNFLVFLYVL